MSTVLCKRIKPADSLYKLHTRRRVTDGLQRQRENGYGRMLRVLSSAKRFLGATPAIVPPAVQSKFPK